MLLIPNLKKRKHFTNPSPAAILFDAYKWGAFPMGSRQKKIPKPK